MEEAFENLFIKPFKGGHHKRSKDDNSHRPRNSFQPKNITFKNAPWNKHKKTKQHKKKKQHGSGPFSAIGGNNNKSKDDDNDHDELDEEDEDDTMDTNNNNFDQLDDRFSTRVMNGQKQFGIENRANFMKVVFAKPIDMMDGIMYMPPSFPKSSDEYKFISKSLEKVFIFQHLDEKQKKTMIDAFEMVKVKKDKVIIQQGDVHDLYYYLIESGNVQFLIDDIPIPNKIGSSGYGFGEIALLYNAPRSASALALTDCKLWRVDQKTFRKIIAHYNIKKDDETKHLLHKVHFLKDVPDSTLTKMTYALQTCVYNKGDVVTEGLNHFFYVVKSGKLKATNIEFGGNTYPDMDLGVGEYFGEVAVLKNLDVHAKVIALEDNTTLFRMSRENFIRQLGKLEDVIMKNRDIKRLMLIPLKERSNNNLKIYEAEALAELVQDYNFQKGHVFYKEGIETKPVLYLIRKGNVQVKASMFNIEFLTGLEICSGSTDTLTEEGFFGEEALSHNGLTKKDHNFIPKYTATATEDCTVGVLTYKDIVSVMFTKFGGKVKLDEVQTNKILGKGTFGTVWLISLKGTDDVFAFKVQNKRRLIEYNQADGVINERNIMYKLDSPNIISLIDSFQDERFLYMVMKLYSGGELRSLIHTKKRHALPEWAAKFYSATILDALTFMHKRHILYRDLKPENVMIDNIGYTVIIDLGFAKIVPDKTYTFCGTPLYLAPEVILQKGHDKAYDHWSWGILVYEMIVGITPFYEDGIDQVGLFKSIVNLKYEFPKGNYMSENSKDLIRKLLTTKPHERLGSFAKSDLDIRNHPWFDEIDWSKISSRTLEAPWVPSVKNQLDTSNFDEWEEDEPDEKEKPLTTEEQKLFLDF